MSFEFNEPVTEAAKFSNHLLDEAERHEEAEDIAGSFEPLDEVISELEAALSEARKERENLESRVEDVRKVLGLEEGEHCEADYGDGPLEGPLEEAYENAEFAMDDGFSNMSADEVL